MPEYNLLTDADLFSLFCKGDRFAYIEIYDRYSGLLYIHVYKKIRNKEDARDLIQELFTVIWNRRTQVELKTELSAYLYKAVRNKLIDRLNHNNIKSAYISSVQGDLDNFVNVTDHKVRQELLAKLIEKEVDALPEKMKQIFVLSRNEHLSHKEISTQLNISEQTVRKQINYALRVLRPKLSKLFSFF